MATFYNTFEEGTNGSTITSSNSGTGGNTAYVTSIGSNSTLTYATSAAFHGSLGMQVQTTAQGVATFVQQDITLANRNAIRFYFNATSIPNYASNFTQIRGSAGAAVQLFLNTDGTIFAADLNGTEIPGTTTSAITAGTWYRVELAVAPGTTTTSGAVDFALYAGDSTTAINTFSVTGVNSGSVQSYRYRLGRPSASNFVGIFNFDDAQAQDLASGFIGPTVVTTPQTSTPFEWVWDGTQWVSSPEDELVWTGSSWT